MVTKGAVGSRQEFPRGCCPEASSREVNSPEENNPEENSREEDSPEENNREVDNQLESLRGCCLPKEVSNPVAVALS